MEVLNLINKIVIGIVSVAFMFQIVYLFLFFLKPEQFKPAKTKHKFAVIIPAHNESSVIGATVRNLTLQKYPKDCYTIFVIADNCTDDTARIARVNGAIVYENYEPNPKKRSRASALKFGIDKIMVEFPEIEAFIAFDADDMPLPTYIDKMNDAFDGGVELARGYNHATNLTQNMVSGVSGLWYIRDCRFNCHARSALHIGQMMVGPGMMFSAEIMRKDGGWTAMSKSEDAEFTCRQLMKKRKAHYVSEAVVYEDQPATLGTLFKRNMRMGKGLNKLFFTYGLGCLGKFFISFRYTLLDMFLTLLFIPIAVLCCVWFPAYYIILFGQFLAPLPYEQFIWEIENLAIILGCAFIIPFIAQAFLVYFLDRKKIGTPLKKTLLPILTFPIFMIIYALGICAGVLFNAKWKSIERSKYYDESFKQKLELETGVSFDWILNGDPVEGEDADENQEDVKVVFAEDDAEIPFDETDSAVSNEALAESAATLTEVDETAGEEQE